LEALRKKDLIWALKEISLWTATTRNPGATMLLYQSLRTNNYTDFLLAREKPEAVFSVVDSLAGQGDFGALILHDQVRIPMTAAKEILDEWRSCSKK